MYKLFKILALTGALGLGLVGCTSDPSQTTEAAETEKVSQANGPTEASETTQESKEGTDQATSSQAKDTKDPAYDDGNDDPIYGLYTIGTSIDDLKKEGQPIIMTMGNKACIYCEQMRPHLEGLSKKTQGEAIIKYVDTDLYKDLVAEYPIYGTPATVLIDSEGNPYEPSEEFKDLVYQFAEQGSEEPSLSMVFGYLDEGQLEKLIEEMTKG